MTMKIKTNVMAGLIGLALIATPIAAAAQDQNGARNETHQTQVQKHETVPAPRNMKPVAPVNREIAPPPPNMRPVAPEARDWRDHRDHNYRDYRNYGDRDYGRHYDRDYVVETPVYVMPRGYAGGACAWAQHLRNVYNEDRNTGHPAAAEDLLGQLHQAERNCGGVPYGFNDFGLFR
jgi:hypothetical protein